jgi:broad specificity phosphatase PhoE
LTLYLVRHGRPLVDRTRPAHTWSLDPSYDDDVRALRSRLPGAAAWYSSPEPKAFMTARLLTESPIEIVPDLREHERNTADWVDDFDEVVGRAFTEPDRPAYDGWEPLARCRERVVRVVSGILGTTHRDADVVLVGHGTAWTCLLAALRGAPPDLDAWSRMAMPDVLQCRVPDRPGDMLAP